MKTTATHISHLDPVVIRMAHSGDESALRRLAVIDSAEALEAPVAIAEVDGEIRAALSLWDGFSIADPFFPTADLVELLRDHSRRLRARAERIRAPRRRLVPRPARA
jgi:hypothetical protein